ncbi:MULTISPECIES: hypothetical protein [Mycobacteroides]|uniref:hypothetical protein n=1 Tax=Mycobacteroides TaxID=670516 RepID=UPI000926BCA5|nr:hypothetical protein [Mycobacteroides abscessus]NGX06437.1 hypothetical protein [Mycobacteroides franklinii]SHT25529.1 Uncharacterised protein [Mycobacteroides abscessus subsp. abscessus]SHW69114.1 Uncharacterised protein [Mycobacteroides abscessus subsp. abscessus]SHY71011.1 Uncharacterised protein [Mycobacteroides abscessus subsp. abscessus]SHZ44044.1 Uncharacterised protein [Mycobacteroides abscessus subsp. abscessus]
MSEYDANEANILVSELRVIKFINSEGDLHTIDLSQGQGGSELEDCERADLIEWAQSFGLAPKVMAVIASLTDEGGESA